MTSTKTLSSEKPARPEAFRSRIVGEGSEAPDQLLANPANWRVHPQHQMQALEGVLDQVGWVQRVIVNRTTGHVVDGHARVALALRREEPAVPVLYVELTEAEERLILASLDPLAALAVTDQDMLDSLLRDVEAEGDALGEFLAGLATQDEDPAGSGGDGGSQPGAGSLAAKFMIPPFSVLNAREGWWQERKRAWLALGIKSELGRGGGAATPPHPPTVTQNPDGTLNYGGAAGQSERFDRQRQPNACPGGSPLSLARAKNAKKAGASPGGSPRPAADYSKRQRGDGTGKGI